MEETLRSGEGMPGGFTWEEGLASGLECQALIHSRHKDIVDWSQGGCGNGSGVLERCQGGACAKAGSEPLGTQGNTSERVVSGPALQPSRVPSHQEQRPAVGKS